MTHTAPRPASLPVRTEPRPITPWALGALLYTPATRTDLTHLCTAAMPTLPAIALCTEDAVLERDLPAALHNLERTCADLAGQGAGPLRLIRVRSPEVLRRAAQWDLSGISGFVLPKIHADNLMAYAEVLRDLPEHLSAQLTVETREALSEHEMLRLRDLILTPGIRERVSGLRMGGNDLLNVLGLRRTPGRTLYQGPLERTASMLVNVFAPHDLQVSSPVYEVFKDQRTLEREVEEDLAFGMQGKTIIHPAQLPTVLAGLQVSAADHAEAEAMLAPDAPAVFSVNGRMCEPTTHGRWARSVLQRSARYGIRPDLDADLLS